ncbi:hypothetical protein HV819_08215 [Anaerococcus sp. AGMB00486]|uniref:Uncharacterized protein n=2 Tax=Anaerococcus TaxID=165779 RepID=A0ABX2NB64_9FIRM|nr:MULTISPECIES: hypothetical protein [Anaerococcus]MSS78204.1 hypothetical protein [Anaerococcus porci]NVF11962.1 hypothetical protein [Anaerococcus faecalis]
MNNLNYDEILNFLNQRNISIILITALVLIVVLLLLTRLFVKLGLFLLVFTFVIDNIIKLIPIDIYEIYPITFITIKILYIVGFIIFLLKVIKNIRKNKAKKEYYEDKNLKLTKKDNPIKRFFRYTGSLPFLLMLILNILINTENNTYQSIITALTSLSFLFMVFTSLFNTYKRIDMKKYNDNRMRFDDLKGFFKKNKKSNKNADRKILKTDKANINKDETIRLDKEEIRKDVENSDKRINTYLNDLEKDLYDIDLFSMINLENTTNISLITLTNLKTGQKKSYESNKAKVVIKEDIEYKVDLEFENYNDYDYGRFIDLLIEYSQNKSKFKFQLDLIPQNMTNSKIVLYDPSNLYELDKKFNRQFQGKTISMNFPKYKINFIQEN